MRRVGCKHCGATQLVPTWNEPEPEPPISTIVCVARACGKPFNTHL